MYLYIFIFITFLNFSIAGQEIVTDSKKNKEKIKEKSLYILMGIYSVVVVIFIPLITKSFIDNNLGKISWFSFILPGLASILLIEIQKKKPFMFESFFMEIIYFPIFILFFILRIYGFYSIFQSIFFSVIVALSISISIKIRKRFFNVNLENDTKYLIQTLSFMSSIFTLIVSVFVGIKISCNGLFFLAMFANTYIIFKRRDFNVNTIDDILLDLDNLKKIWK